MWQVVDPTTEGEADGFTFGGVRADELPELVERVAALDLGKATVTACVRVPHPGKPGRRCQEVQEYRTTTASLLALAGDLRGHGVTLVAMEATRPGCRAAAAVWLRSRTLKPPRGPYSSPIPKLDRVDRWLYDQYQLGNLDR